MKRWMGVFAALLVLGAAALLLWPRPQAQAGTRLVGMETTPPTGFSRAEGARVFSFPQDFGPHPDFQTEWWYYTGNLSTIEGRRFGFQLTFFRRALSPPGKTAERSSEWAVKQVYLAHFTLSDLQAGSFHFYEKSDRGAAGLAGAQTEPSYQVWLGAWSVAQTDSRSYRLDAGQDRIQLSLELRDQKGPVLQGINGYSQKGSDPGNASYYFSQTRLEAQGTVTIDGHNFPVEGSSWMDHEFSTSALSPDQVGWDWFGLQLDDGSELMIYTLRRADGSVDPYSQGTLVAIDSQSLHLSRDDFRIDAVNAWKSPHSGATYPAEWQLTIPEAQLDLTVKPLMADQELRVSFTYWEGAVQVSGTRGGKAVSGAGYVELTGYKDSMQGQGP